MQEMSVKEKLIALRELMLHFNADYYYVPSSDPHRNEYVPPCWQRRAWISGFTGSAGDALIGQKDAYLWTDPRYFLQAEKQLDANIYQLMKQAQGTPPIDQWLAEKNENIVLAVDPKVISIAQAQQLQKALTPKKGKLLATSENLIDKIWQNCPPLPHLPINLYPEKYAGMNTLDKMHELRLKLKENNADAIVISTLDDIAWLLNIRGNDIEFNPLVISYLIVSQDQALLFIDLEKVDSNQRIYLSHYHVTLKSYSDLESSLGDLQGKIWIDPTQTSWWVEQQLATATLLLKPSPLLLMKAIKNPIEQQGMRKAHMIDAIAIISLMEWLETHWQQGLTEISVAQQLECFRREHADFLENSFDTISGFKENSAVIHYRSTSETNKVINNTALYLLDSGGQYWYGTTDVTRTLHLGEPTEEERYHYTLVLKGHLALRHLIFPEGTCGEHINVIARTPLWQNGLDYGHGTGHGVGVYLCVHEGPQSISSKITQIPLVPGMIVSNEPGLYFPEKYGIRIENLCLINQIYPQEKSLSGHGPFYGFEDLTLVPYCKKLINTSLLNETEKGWINDYHKLIFKELADQLPSKELKKWLAENTSPLA